MADVFLYMFFVGSGIASGVGVIALIGYKIYQRLNRKQMTKKRGIV